MSPRLRTLALLAGLLLHLLWGAELWIRSQLPLWHAMDADQKRCHLEAWLSGHRAQYGDGRCESLE